MDVFRRIRHLQLREKLSLHEIARRTLLSHNTVKTYLKKTCLKAETAEPKFDISNRPSKLDPFSEKLAAWLKSGRQSLASSVEP